MWKTDEDHMHTLVLPDNYGAPELKAIPPSWAEARATLQRKWEVKYGSMVPVADSDTGSDMDSGCIQMRVQTNFPGMKI